MSQDKPWPHTDYEGLRRESAARRATRREESRAIWREHLANLESARARALARDDSEAADHWDHAARIARQMLGEPE